MLVRALIAAVTLSVVAAGADRPLTPVEARKKVGEAVTVEMTVRATKDRLQKHGEIYLDSEEDFRDSKNFAVVITRAGAARFKKAGVGDPAGHFKGKTVRASGTVKDVKGVPRIEVDDPARLKVVQGR
jgi:DNA/RNA endonuclease YhcR with UshA esterase domain